MKWAVTSTRRRVSSVPVVFASEVVTVSVLLNEEVDVDMVALAVDVVSPNVMVELCLRDVAENTDAQ